MISQTVCDKIVEIKDGAIICPRCLRKIRGVRIGPDTAATQLNIQCQGCKHRFDISIEPGPRSSSQRH